MKKFFPILVLSILGSVTILQAQELHYGFKAGLNVSNWEGDAVDVLEDVVTFSSVAETQSRLGFHVGGFTEMSFGDQISVEAGMYYSQKGIDLDANLSDINVGNIELPANLLNIDISARSQYLDIPIVGRFKPVGGFSIYAGPQFSFLLSNKLDLEASVLGFSAFNESLDIKNGFNTMDVAIVGGVGYEFDNGIQVNAGYDFGLSSLDENGSFDAQNRVLKFSVGYKF